MPLSRNEFDKLLEKYLMRKCSAEEQKLMEHWYKAIGNASGDHNEDPSGEAETKMWKTTQEKAGLTQALDVRKLINPKRKIGYRLLTSIAASVALFVLVGIYFLSSSKLPDMLPAIVQSNEKETEKVTIKNTDTKMVKPVRLDDGSLVVLQPNSEIQYTLPFVTVQREVTLVGEAFFEIAKDTNHPFLVHAQGLVTKVLGTSFNIKARPGAKTIVVDVKTGKVAVYRESNKERIKERTNELLLMPNQQAIYNRDANEIVQQLQEDPQIIITEKEVDEMRFDEAPAFEVFSALERAYGVDLVFDETVFLNCTLTTRLGNEGLFERLEIICKALGANYKTKETQVFIVGNGCE